MLFEYLQKKDYKSCLKILYFWITITLSDVIIVLVKGPPRICFDWLYYSFFQQRQFNDHFYYRFGELYLKDNPTANTKIYPGNPIREIEYPVREAIIQMHLKNIFTVISEGGGGFWHGLPDYAYVDAILNNENVKIMREQGFIVPLNSPGMPNWSKNPLIINKNSKTWKYVRIGFNRKNLTTKEVVAKMHEITKLLNVQVA